MTEPATREEQHLQAAADEEDVLQDMLDCTALAQEQAYVDLFARGQAQGLTQAQGTAVPSRDVPDEARDEPRRVACARPCDPGPRSETSVPSWVTMQQVRQPGFWRIPAPATATFVLVKPDGMARGLAGAVLARFEAAGFAIERARVAMPSLALARAHYAAHAGKAFFAGLTEFLASGPCLALVLVAQGDDAVPRARAIVGAVSDSKDTLRGTLATSVRHNVVHASDSDAECARETALWFGPAYDEYEAAEQARFADA